MNVGTKISISVLSVVAALAAALPAHAQRAADDTARLGRHRDHATPAARDARARRVEQHRVTVVRRPVVVQRTVVVQRPVVVARPAYVTQPTYSRAYRGYWSRWNQWSYWNYYRSYWAYYRNYWTYYWNYWR
jgi:hypothetical protein